MFGNLNADLMSDITGRNYVQILAIISAAPLMLGYQIEHIVASIKQLTELSQGYDK